MASSQQLIVDIGQGLSLMIGLPTIARWKTSERPSDAKPGTFGFNTETKNLEYWNGTDWLGAPMEES